jgi:hypothetical protein
MATYTKEIVRYPPCVACSDCTRHSWRHRAKPNSVVSEASLIRFPESEDYVGESVFGEEKERKEGDEEESPKGGQEAPCREETGSCTRSRAGTRCRSTRTRRSPV